MKLVRTDTEAILSAPYRSRFPRLARQLGGTWDGSHWRFPLAMVDELKPVLREVFGMTWETRPHQRNLAPFAQQRAEAYTALCERRRAREQELRLLDLQRAPLLARADQLVAELADIEARLAELRPSRDLTRS